MAEIQCGRCRQGFAAEVAPGQPSSCPHCGHQTLTPQETLTSKHAYNLVSDLGTGVNLRWRDNLLQALCIFVCLVLGVLIGFAIARGPEGAILGGAAGLLVGLFGSGIFLMIFRALQHARGKHD
jgi:hypothetical protein